MTRRTLFEISSDLLALDALLSERDGDITDPEVAATIDAWFAELSYDEAHKLESWCGYVAQLEMEAERARVEAAAWHAKARSRENRMAWLRARMLAYIESSGRSKVVTASGRTLAVQQNGGKAPVHVFDVDPSEVPVEFVRVKREIDVDAVREHLEAGKELPFIFAVLQDRGTHLRVRT